MIVAATVIALRSHVEWGRITVNRAASAARCIAARCIASRHVALV